jgi:3-hydroxy acid dehydrogenase/malonic semialdehyde reductase
MELEGRTILLTGSNRGIGHALLTRLAAEPVRLLAGVRELDRYRPPDGPMAAEVEPLRVDLSTREDIDAIDGLENVDVLINNAGEFVGGTVEQLDVDAIYSTVQANLTGLIHLTRRVLPGMLRRDSGKVVNQASIISHLDYPGTGVYAATKAGVATFTHCLRRELEDTSVTTLEVVTGGYDTDMLREAAEQLEPHTDPSRWEWQDPADWADEIVKAIADDEDQLKPSGKSRLGMLVPDAVLDAVAKRSFER